jgi:hypothetical protein
LIKDLFSVAVWAVVCAVLLALIGTPAGRTILHMWLSSISYEAGPLTRYGQF